MNVVYLYLHLVKNIHVDAPFKPLHLYSVLVCRDESYLCRDDESYFSFP